MRVPARGRLPAWVKEHARQHKAATHERSLADQDATVYRGITYTRGSCSGDSKVKHAGPVYSEASDKQVSQRYVHTAAHA